MKLALLYSLLIYQLQNIEAAVLCRPLQRVSDAIDHIPVGKDYPFIIGGACPDGNARYQLYHQDHNTGQLELVSETGHYQHNIFNIQLNTSGVYCTHMQCPSATTTVIDQCCVQLKVPQELRIILPDEIYIPKEEGVCFVSGWPRPQNMTIHAHECGVTLRKTQVIDLYTIAQFFTLQNNSNTCRSISCQSSNSITKPVHIRYRPPDPDTLPNDDETEGRSLEINCGSGGALGIHRITVWIIVLIISLVNTAMISLL